MLRNYVAAALRSLARSRLHATLNVLGLGAGFAAAFLIALYVRHETTFDRFLPHHEELYRLSNQITAGGLAPRVTEDTKGPIIEELRLEFPQIQSISQVMRGYDSRNILRRGRVETVEPAFFWADPGIFDVLQFPAIAGDLHTALQTPNGLVLTRRMARKYFGTDIPMGQTIEVNRQYTMRVTAVLEDLPSNTHLTTEMFASMRALPPLTPDRVYRTYVYLRASPRAVRQIREGMEAFQERHAYVTSKVNVQRLTLTPLREVHFRSGGRQMKPVGDPQLLQALSLIGLLIVLVATINYINLMTARASRRAVEVGIRKAVGATRTDLTLQFIGESLIYSGLAMMLACMLTEILLAPLNAFLDTNISFEWNIPLLASLLGATVLTGILAGIYPALVLSAFKPTLVLKGGVVQGPGAGTLRQLLVLLQFGILIGLTIAATIIHRQTAFGLRSGLRFDHDQMLAITVPGEPDYCTRSAFSDAVRGLQGVRGVACSNDFLRNYSTQMYRAPDGREVMLKSSFIGPGLFELLGLKPVAGRFLSASAADVFQGEASLNRPYPSVVNETAVRQLGYADPKAALGKVFVSLTNVRPGERHEIVGVVPDFAHDSVRNAIEPTFFATDRSDFELEVKLRGQDVPETLAAIDGLWTKTEPIPGPPLRRFVDQFVQDLYLDLTRQGTFYTIFASLAVVLAVLGLFGLAAFTVERRTLEIGVRKALGASTSDVAGLLLWRFVKPVLAANLVAWPLVAWLMSRWLRNFAYHIDLPIWVFPLAAAAAVGIAVITVGAHSVRVARSAPVKALRYE
ncbi:MAG TPA: FtsX-like permease family protein [Steroidobacteraceae bacterium]|jgi:putative ABC transport system permease protein